MTWREMNLAELKRSKHSSGAVKLPRVPSKLSATVISIFHLLIIYLEIFLVFRIANE